MRAPNNTGPRSPFVPWTPHLDADPHVTARPESGWELSLGPVQSRPPRQRVLPKRGAGIRARGMGVCPIKCSHRVDGRHVDRIDQKGQLNTRPARHHSKGCYGGQARGGLEWRKRLPRSAQSLRSSVPRFLFPPLPLRTGVLRFPVSWPARLWRVPSAFGFCLFPRPARLWRVPGPRIPIPESRFPAIGRRLPFWQIPRPPFPRPLSRCLFAAANDQ